MNKLTTSHVTGTPDDKRSNGYETQRRATAAYRANIAWNVLRDHCGNSFHQHVKKHHPKIGLLKTDVANNEKATDFCISILAEDDLQLASLVANLTHRPPVYGCERKMPGTKTPQEREEIRKAGQESTEPKSAKAIILSKPQIRALRIAREVLQCWDGDTDGYYDHKLGAGYFRVIRAQFTIATSHALVLRGLFEHYNSAYIIRITPTGIAWLDEHEAEVRS